ncbi:hypothetical protein C2S51_010439 [Perilla frutescens var. frutescens]|nr:hypothetical protein C2S51_010439 [Perilla frutescens var. frutescens]
MIRGFCRTKADEENLFQVVKNLNGEENIVPISWLCRICLHSDPYKFLSGKLRGPLVRSLVCFCKEASLIKEDHKKAIFRGFKLLRVMNFNSAIKFDRFLEVKKLILLKHINLSIDNLKVIPKQISKLLNLQTLLVETNSPTVTMKANIWKMVKLRHVETKAAIFLDDKKWKVEADRNLQTLSSLSPESCRENISAKASQLKMLGIRGELANRLDTMSLQNFSHLEKLKIKNYESEAKNPMFVLPRLNHFPSNLKKITLSATYLH